MGAWGCEGEHLGILLVDDGNSTLGTDLYLILCSKDLTGLQRNHRLSVIPTGGAHNRIDRI